MAKKKAASCSRNGRDSQSKRLGIKVYGSTIINAGSIIVRQRGTKYLCGHNCIYGRDHTINSTIRGIVQYKNNIINVLNII